MNESASATSPHHTASPADERLTKRFENDDNLAIRCLVDWLILRANSKRGCLGGLMVHSAAARSKASTSGEKSAGTVQQVP